MLVCRDFRLGRQHATCRFEGDIGITVVDPGAAGAPSDYREDDHAETVHEARLEE